MIVDGWCWCPLRAVTSSNPPLHPRHMTRAMGGAGGSDVPCRDVTFVIRRDGMWLGRQDGLAAYSAGSVADRIACTERTEGQCRDTVPSVTMVRWRHTRSRTDFTRTSSHLGSFPRLPRFGSDSSRAGSTSSGGTGNVPFVVRRGWQREGLNSPISFPRPGRPIRLWRLFSLAPAIFPFLALVPPFIVGRRRLSSSTV